MSAHEDKKMKLDEEVETGGEKVEEVKKPKELEEILKRFLVSQQEVAEMFIEIFKRLEQPKIKELWS
jgi:hypothetical protein